ncbi:Hemicentin-2 [Geodia barretti]|nr:Hemicentin-2 [Geodia barretti]
MRVRLIDNSDLEECSFQVWGVATVLVGGANSGNQFYWLDCFHSSLETTWLRVDPGGSVDNTDVSGGTRISFTATSSNHLGLYACMASGGAMEYLNITDEVPGLIPVESSVEAFSGDTVTLSTYISTTNGLLTYVQWKDPSGDTVLEYPAPGEEVNALPSDLVISDASLEESGTYNVTVQSREGLNFRGHTLIFLSVLVPSNITGPPPSELTVDEWEETRLVCEARGSPPLTITWSREGSMLPIDSGIQTSSPYSNEDGTVTVTSTLTITGSRYRDRGRYSCSAYNTLTTISHTDTAESTLNINPMIRIESEDLTSNVVLASFGTSLTIQCFGSGNLVWTTPPNQTVFTSYDPSRNLLTLSIPNFITPARYTCSSDLVAGLEKTILIITDGMVLANVAVFCTCLCS